MENKILDVIIYYYTDNGEDPILFNYSAYNLYIKLETLFIELKKEIINNLESENEGKMDYLNSFDKILFDYYSDEKYKHSRYFIQFNKLTGKIRIETRLLPILESELCLSGHTRADDAIYEEQNVFFEFVKNHLLNDLFLFIKKNKKQLSKLATKKINKSLIGNTPNFTQPKLDIDIPLTIEQKTYSIFKPGGIALFELLLEELDIEVDTISKRASKPSLNAIWNCDISRTIIFKNNTMLKDYVEYLNKRFDITLNNRSRSNGDKYELKVKKFIKLNTTKQTSL